MFNVLTKMILVGKPQFMSQITKKVVLVINCLQGGGAERSVLTLGQGFYELGYEVHILRFKPLVEYDLNPNLNYHMIRFKPYKLILNSQLRYQLFAAKVDKYILSENLWFKISTFQFISSEIGLKI